jgi:hypothetical protein
VGTALAYARAQQVRVHTHLRPRPHLQVLPIDQPMLDEARTA